MRSSRGAAGADRAGAGALKLVIRSVGFPADRVVSIELEARDGSPLPEWEPGAHIDLRLPSGLVRSYSLHGDPSDRGSYAIAVLEVEGGRGGSAEVHRLVRLGAGRAAAGAVPGMPGGRGVPGAVEVPGVQGTPGAPRASGVLEVPRASEVSRVPGIPGIELVVSGPVNSFRLEPAGHYLFLAGGIGVTPLLPMALAATRAGVRWTFVYGGRTRASMAFVDRLSALPGGRLEVVPQDERGLPDLARWFADIPAGGAAYCCGPGGMLAAAVEARARTRPDVAVHIERFQGSAEPPGGDRGASLAGVSSAGVSVADMSLAVKSVGVEPIGGGDKPAAVESFAVELARSGVTIEVPAGVSVLDAVRARIPGVLSNCEQGICSSCETAVLAGVPDHRDSVLTPKEKAANRYMMICVSRSLTPRLVLDL